MGRMDQRIAVIAGVSDEVSEGIAVRMRQEGAKVAFLGYDDQDLTRMTAVTDVAFHAPIANREGAIEAITSVARELGPVDALTNNVIRRYPLSSLERKRAEDVDSALSDVRAAMWMMQAVFPSMKEGGWGRIVNIGSRYGELMNVAIGEYNTACWALRGLTRSAAAEWIHYGIVSNVLEAVTADSDFDRYRANNPEVIDALLDQVAMRRRGDPVEDIGAAAVMLSCEESNLIIGQVVYADGGQHIAAPVFNPQLVKVG